MRRNEIIIACIIALVVIAAAIFFTVAINKPAGNSAAETRHNSVETTPTKSLTPEIISRLQSYPYHLKDPKLGFKEIVVQRPELAKWISDTLFSHIMTFDENERFFTDENLTYLTWDDHFAIRGVYQVRQSNGTYTEQDVEYGYRFGEWYDDNTKVDLVYEGERQLSTQKTIRSDGK